MPRIPDKDFSDVHFKRVPRGLIDKIKAKCAAHSPPLTMRWVGLELMRKWAERDEDPSLKTEPKRVSRKNWRGKKKTPVALVVEPSGVPDLGTAF